MSLRSILPFIDTPAIETALAHHPAVKSVRADFTNSRVVAHVVPDLNCPEIETQQLAHWREIYDESFAATNDMLHGWISSYTGDPLPREDMEKWVAATTERILSLMPHCVIEIGSGTGLLADRIAPLTGRYIAIDAAQACQDRLSDLIRTRPDLSHIEQITADAGSLPADLSADMVILNSIVQYFPNAAYLTRVIERTLGWIGNGAIFVGDIRDLDLLPDFYELLARYRGLTAKAEIDRFVSTRMVQEEEFAISPAYFHALTERFSRIHRVRVLRRTGRRPNELTTYRYDAIIHVGLPRAQDGTDRNDRPPVTNDPALPLARVLLPGLLRHFLEQRSLMPECPLTFEIIGIEGEGEPPADNTANDSPEDRLVGLWRTCLQSPSIGPDDDFFAAGGSSLLVMQLRKMIGDEFGVTVPLSVFSRGATPRTIGRVIQETLSQSG